MIKSLSLLVALVSFFLTGAIAYAADAASSGPANYKDLSQTPDRFMPRTPAEVRAKKIADTIANNWFSFHLALAIPTDPKEMDDFLTGVQGSANPPAVKDYVAQCQLVLATTLDLVERGTNAVSDDEVAKYLAVAGKLRPLEVKVSYDNPEPDGTELNADYHKPVLDTKARHVVNDLVQLGQSGAVKVNDAPADKYKEIFAAVQKSRIHDIYEAAKINDSARQKESSMALVPLVTKEINGALWQYRELNILIVSGMAKPDQTAMEVFNRLIDELEANLKDERRAL